MQQETSGRYRRRRTSDVSSVEGWVYGAVSQCYVESLQVATFLKLIKQKGTPLCGRGERGDENVSFELNCDAYECACVRTAGTYDHVLCDYVQDGGEIKSTLVD